MFFRVEVFGLENIPKKGSCILACNHYSNLDPPLVGAFIRRDDLYFMGKEELFKLFGLRQFMHFLGVFPVRRGMADVRALKNTFDILNKGHIILMFPEGTRRKPNRKIAHKKGIGMISSKAKVEIIPIKLENTNKYFKLKKMRIIVGKPIKIDHVNNKDYIEISRYVLDRIEDLK
ncbi:lysophospholipid acyltransferase family protein [bacterium]